MNDETTPPSPCVSLCRMRTDWGDAPGGLCEGCLRTLEEITRWASADARYKRMVWQDIGRRRSTYLEGIKS